uniref:RRM domain-containing protein n=1 Tax=Anopheles farauti TaxID=69004 RepID=A0A182QKP8_9DIPT
MQHVPFDRPLYFLQQYLHSYDNATLRQILVPYLTRLKTRDLKGKPFFAGLDEHLNDDDGSGGGGFIGANQLQLNSPARSSPHSNGSETTERFSRKVFVGGLPPDIDEEEITTSFNQYGDLIVDWPHKAESKSYFPPKGYAFLLFQEERGVQKLIETCVPDDDKLYITVSSPTIKNKAVQIRPWRLADADFVLDASMPLDPRKTVFVGGVPRPLKAYELAMIMDRLYGGVCYAGIDTDPELKYPKGAGRVAFSNQQSYIAAISARFVQLQHGDIDKRVEVKPYVLDDQMCDECHGQRCGGKFAPFFCANVTCLQDASTISPSSRKEQIGLGRCPFVGVNANSPDQYQLQLLGRRRRRGRVVELAALPPAIVSQRYPQPHLAPLRCPLPDSSMVAAAALVPDLPDPPATYRRRLRFPGLPALEPVPGEPLASPVDYRPESDTNITTTSTTSTS